jgi:hypothetical protein
MNDFWLSSGHHLVDRDANGRLVVTDALLKAYLARPEVLPPPEACLVERAVHQRLLRDPRAVIEASEIAGMADRDARENWRHLLAFRDHLLAHKSLEDAYLALARYPKVSTPPVFLNQLVHIILRGLLDGETDAFRLRAAELLFRAQRLSVQDGLLLLADEETVDGNATDPHAAPLVALFGDARARSLDVLRAETAPQYFARSDTFDMVLDFRFGQPGRRAFADVLEHWVGHLLGSRVTIEPVATIRDERWAWFVGLDQEGTRIGNALWRGETPADGGLDRIVALFTLTFADPLAVIERIRGAPISLIMGMTGNRIVRVKPQNLVAGLPLIDTRTG